MTSLKIVFMGTPQFSVPPLQALLESSHDIVAVYTQPPRPAGRGEKIRKSSVHEFAEQHGLSVLTPPSLKSEETHHQFRRHQADIAIVVAYGLMVPKQILDTPSKGCVNIHASLLPRWRGAAPIQRTIQAGDEETGITLIQMDETLDTGPMLLKRSLLIKRETTGETLHDSLSRLGAELIVEYLEKIGKYTLSPIPQPLEGVTYASKLTREESQIDWSLSAVELERTLRAFTPWPGLYFTYHSHRIKLLKVAVIETLQGKPGTVLDDQLTIACGKGALKIIDLQREGKTAMSASAFLNGISVPRGTRLS